MNSFKQTGHARIYIYEFIPDTVGRSKKDRVLEYTMMKRADIMYLLPISLVYIVGIRLDCQKTLTSTSKLIRGFLII